MEMISIDPEKAKAAIKHGYNGLFGTPDNVYEFIKLMLSGMPDKSGTMTLSQGILNHMALRCLALEEDAVEKLENFPKKTEEEKELYFLGFLEKYLDIKELRKKLYKDTDCVHEEDLCDFWECITINGKLFDYNYQREIGMITIYRLEDVYGEMATDPNDSHINIQPSIFKSYCIGKIR